jgi:hypothetical protein
MADASEHGRGNWGTSPGFYPDAEPEIMRTADGIEVPVYNSGYLEEISVLPENCACNFFTRLIAKKERSMEPRIKDALVALFGDEAKANEFISKVDETNRAIADGGLLTRETTTEETEATTTEEVTETPPEIATTPDKPLNMPATSESVLTRLCTLEVKANEVLAQHQQRIDALEAVAIPEQQAAPTTADLDAIKTLISDLGAKVDALVGRMDAMETANGKTTQAVDALKLTDEEKQRTWLADRPANSATQPVTYRPREERRSDPAGTKQSLADVAAGTLAKMPK